MNGRLHERERELSVIVDALDEAADGRGRVVVVEGPAGIGKTGLADSVSHSARARSFATAGARGSELELAYAWGVVRQLLEPRLRGMTGEARSRVLAGAAALAGPIVLPDGASESRDADQSFGVLHGLYWLVAGLAAQRPQLLVVDDLHWADGASVRFLEFLTNRIDAIPVLLLVTERPGATGAALRAAAVTTAIDLAPLSSAATAAVLAERNGAPVSVSFAEACHGATGGNPLLIHRLADGLRDRGVDGGGDADAAAVARLGPYAVAGAVGATLARLGDGPVRLARSVAVLDTAPLLTAARLAGIEQDQASAFGEQLVRAGILRDVRPLEFQHGLVRDAVLEGMTVGERARLHADAARILEQAGAAPEDVAIHLLHAEPRGDESVAATLADAGRRALVSGAPTEAAASLERALAEPPSARDRSPLLLDLARAENGVGRPEALDHVLAAFDAAGDAAERAEAALALMWSTGPGRQDPRQALAMIEQARAEVAGRDRELELKLEAARFSVIFMSEGLLRDALGEPERFSDLEGRTEGECELLLHVAMHRFLRGCTADEVGEPLERAVADPEIVRAIGADSIWLPFVVWLLLKTDWLDVARRTLEVAYADAQRRGSAPGFASTSVWRAWIALRVGSATDAEADARAAYEVLPDEMWQQVFCASCLIDVLAERGELDEAQAALEAWDDAKFTSADRVAELLLSCRSRLRAAQGDVRGALADQLETRRLSGEGLAPDPDFEGWLRIVRLLHATGDEAGATREADAALRWARGWGAPGYIGQAMTVAGLVAGGEEGLALLREAVEHLERSPARRELALSLVELGAALRRWGERRAAREPLRRALDICSEGGLVAIGERAREELRLTGAKVRRPASTGLDSLTPSERRIVDLAAAGASNPEIAQALFVTVKTVEMHLGNAYRKLGIRSRRQLEAFLPRG
jgi:DNA-binding CsgD family transcriptional regulator